MWKECGVTLLYLFVMYLTRNLTLRKAHNRPLCSTWFFPFHYSQIPDKSIYSPLNFHFCSLSLRVVPLSSFGWSRPGLHLPFLIHSPRVSLDADSLDLWVVLDTRGHFVDSESVDTGSSVAPSVELYDDGSGRKLLSTQRRRSPSRQCHPSEVDVGEVPHGLDDAQ